MAGPLRQSLSLGVGGQSGRGLGWTAVRTSRAWWGSAPEAQGSRPAPSPGAAPPLRSLQLHIAMHTAHTQLEPTRVSPPASGLGFTFLSFSAAPWGSRVLTCVHC